MLTCWYACAICEKLNHMANEYDQWMPQSQTTDHNPRFRVQETQSHDSKNTIQVKQPVLSLSEMIAKLHSRTKSNSTKLIPQTLMHFHVYQNLFID